jgi:hypothetical protein
MDRGIPFRQEYNLIKHKQAGVPLAAVLLLNDGDAFLKTLCQLANVGTSELVEQVGKVLAKLPLVGILASLKGVITRHPAISKGVTSCALKNVAVGQDRLTIATIIITCWSKAEDQCPLFLEYGYLREAYQTAVASKQKALMPIIAYKAYLTGNFDLVKECQKKL